MADKKKRKVSEVERLERDARKANKKLREARAAESERRGLGAFRDQVKEVTEAHNERLERLTGYDTNDKARTFGFGAFDAPDGTLKWVRMDAVYALEVTSPSIESGIKAVTLLKTVDGPVDVVQSPDGVINEFVLVRNAYSAENVRELQSELLRREDKVAERKAKKSGKKVDDHPIVNGPDFAAVSDAISGAVPGDLDYEEPEVDFDPVDDEPDDTTADLADDPDEGDADEEAGR